MSDEPPRKAPDAATLDDLRPVDTEPVLSPVSTITLDEDPPAAPPPTMLLDPVPDAPAPRPTTAQPRLDVEANATAPVARRRAALKSDAFESSPTLGVAPPRPTAMSFPQLVRERSPLLVALVVMAIAVVAMAAWLLFWG